MVKLEILGIWIPELIFCGYYDDGFVDSIIKHTEKLSKRYGENFLDYSRDSHANGKIVEGKGLFRTHYHIFYLDKGNEITNLRIRAHEETHFLEMTGCLDKLERKLLEEQGVKISFDSICLDNDDTEGREVIAHIGAIYAMVKKGFNPGEVKTSIDAFKFARELYKSSRIKE